MECPKLLSFPSICKLFLRLKFIDTFNTKKIVAKFIIHVCTLPLFVWLYKFQNCKIIRFKMLGGYTIAFLEYLLEIFLTITSHLHTF